MLRRMDLIVDVAVLAAISLATLVVIGFVLRMIAG